VPEGPSIVDQIRGRQLDSDLAALLWLLAAERVPIHVVSDAVQPRLALADALRALVADSALVTDGPGSRIEDVLRQPVPLRPATGVVVVADDSGRTVAAHLHRPPLRDAAGHVQPQRPAVLAEWNAKERRWENFAWGVLPDLAAEMGGKAGDVEVQIADRAAFLQGLASIEPSDPVLVETALRDWPKHVERVN
jgi:hypothetical protein